MTTQPLPGMTPIERHPAAFWRARFDDPNVVASYIKHGRCSECGWFGGHCSHTATLGPDGSYHP
jgi:hypothetical protein